MARRWRAVCGKVVTPSLEQPIFEALERPKAGEFWGSFLEHVDLRKPVNMRQKTTSYLEQISVFQSGFLCTCCLHLSTRHIAASWASECPHPVGRRWRYQTWHSWLTGADLSGGLLAACHFGSREGPAAPGRATICCLLRNCFSNKKNRAALIVIWNRLQDTLISEKNKVQRVCIICYH